MAIRLRHTNGGCDFAEDAGRDAVAARIFWTANRDPSVLRAHANSARAGLDIAELDDMATVLRCKGGTESLLVRNGRCWLRVDIVSGTLLDGPVELDLLVTGTVPIEPQLGALRMVAALRRDGRLPADGRGCDLRLQREVLALRAHDARMDGASMQDIARALFGQEGAGGWMGSSDYLKSRIRRLVALARHRAEGGYNALLR